ncbi:MAG TPA: hypothetical protein VK451_08620 [Methyloceanibacter sp.]|nr:hypothetical protein [Methyloceanibacter sp.]
MRPARLILVAALVSFSSAALAESADGNGALALAALVAENSPLLGATDKAVLAKFLNGQTNVAYPAGETTLVSADKITCRASNVDITEHSCDLAFGKKTVMLMGRRAHELYTTLAEIGVQVEGAAGSSFAALSNLKCAINPSEVQQKSGGGAHCDYSPLN